MYSKERTPPPVRISVILQCLSAVQVLELCSLLPLRNTLERIFGGLVLLSMACVAFVLSGFLCVQCSKTNAFGRLYLDRLTAVVKNNQLSPLRTYFEVSAWSCTVLSSFLLTSSYLQSMCCGTITGIIAIHLAEQYDSALLNIQFIVDRELWLKLFGLSLEVAYIATECMQVLCVELWTEAVSTRSTTHSLHDLSTSFLILLFVVISLVVASELCMLWAPTRAAGFVLQSRLIYARYNWEHALLRSIAEAGVLFLVVTITFKATQTVLATIYIGTCAAIALILIGEYLSSTSVAAIDPTKVPQSEHWVKFLPLLVLIGWIGSRALHFLLSHSVSIATSIALTAVAITLFVGLARVLTLWHHTAAIGDTLQTRVLEFRRNALELHPVRTFIELGSSLGVMYGSVALYHDFLLATVLATISGVTVVLAGEGSTRWRPSREKPEQRSTVMTFLVLFIMIGSVAFNSIYTHLNHVGISAVLATMVGVVFSCLSEHIIASTSADDASLILQDRFINTRSNWKRFPVRSTIEMGCWIGVCVGTFLISTNLFLACLFGTLSGALVTLGGEVLRRNMRFVVHDVDPVPSISTFIFISYGSILAIYVIYHSIANIEVAFCLASLSGVLFISVSELFLIWQPTRVAGLCLQDRILNSRENWKTQPIRSFVEIGCWLGTTYGSFALSGELFLALQLGTFAAIVVTLFGEYCRNNLLVEDDQTHENRSKVLPFILLLGYIGIGTFTWIFENMRRIELALFLTIIACVTLLTVADILIRWKPTRVAGYLLQKRVLNSKENWSLHPVRSFIEVGVWMGVIYGSYAMYHNVLVAVHVGTISGTVVILSGEAFKYWYSPALTETPEVEPNVPLMALLGILGAMVFDTIYTHLHRIEIAFLLATLTGSAFLVIGDLFACWRPTRVMGCILQDRIAKCRQNTRNHPIRTGIEISSCLVVLYTSFGLTGSLLTAIKIGTATGIVICLATELILNHKRTMEETLVVQLKKKPRYSTQSQVTLMKVPYDVLFEMACYLTPEDLLNVRTTCHRVNGMLRAEASRYWNRPSMLQEERKVRSLIYDAAVNLFAQRDRTKLESSKSLRWVHFNASWIREQKLPLLDSSDGEKVYTIEKGHVGYTVFRHMPDKVTLGIHYIPSAKVLVPKEIYHKMQQDPLIYTASKSISDVQLLSVWHLILALLALVSILLLTSTLWPLVSPIPIQDISG